MWGRLNFEEPFLGQVCIAANHDETSATVAGSVGTEQTALELSLLKSALGPAAIVDTPAP